MRRDSRTIRLTVPLQRKHPSLPVYVVIPGPVVAHWRLAGKTPISGTANGVDFGERNLKAWGKGRDEWFVEFTKPLCEKAGLRVGEPVSLEMRVAD